MRPFLKERRMAFENFVVRNCPEYLFSASIYICPYLYLSQVVGNIFPIYICLRWWEIFVQYEEYLFSTSIYISNNLFQVVGREKEERAPPLPDLLQVKSLIVKANCDHKNYSNCSNVEGENKLFDDLKAFYDSRSCVQGIGSGGDSRVVVVERGGNGRRGKEGLISRYFAQPFISLIG